MVCHGRVMVWHGIVGDMAWHSRGMSWHGRGMVWRGVVGEIVWHGMIGVWYGMA